MLGVTLQRPRSSSLASCAFSPPTSRPRQSGLTNMPSLRWPQSSHKLRQLTWLGTLLLLAWIVFGLKPVALGLPMSSDSPEPRPVPVKYHSAAPALTYRPARAFAVYLDNGRSAFRDQLDWLLYSLRWTQAGPTTDVLIFYRPGAEKLIPASCWHNITSIRSFDSVVRHLVDSCLLSCAQLSSVPNRPSPRL